MPNFPIDATVSQILSSRGIDAAQGVFGGHKVRLGSQRPVRLDNISSAHIPFQGVTHATRLTRAQAGLRQAVDGLVEAVCAEGGPNAEGLLKSLKTALNYQARLARLGDGGTVALALEAKLAVMNEGDRGLLAKSLLSEQLDVLDLAIRRERLINRKASGTLTPVVNLLQDIRAQVTGISGLTKTENDVLACISAPEKFSRIDFETLSDISDNFARRLVAGGTLTADQKADSLFRLAPAVERLSNTRLAALAQRLNSADLTLYQDSLMGKTDPKSRARADMLFSLQALVLKEVSNRVANSRLDEAIAKKPAESQDLNKLRPKSLSGRFCPDVRPLAADPRPGDMSTANLEILTETSSRTATLREKGNGQRAKRLASRGFSMKPQHARRILQEAPVTINFTSRRLLSGDGIFDNPDRPMQNIFHRSALGHNPKGTGYTELRDTVEKKYFPEFEGHPVNPDERPTYAAVNLPKLTTGAATGKGYGNCCIVLKSSVKQRCTYCWNDSLNAIALKIDNETIDAFRKLCTSELPKSLADKLANPNSREAQRLEDVLASLRQVASIGRPVTVEQFNGHVVFSGQDEESMNGQSQIERLMIKAFCVKNQPRELLATQDNMEVLLDQMDEFNTASLANTYEQVKRNGEAPQTCISHNYLEAQVQGPIIPSRDIAEIVVNVSEFSDEDLAIVEQKAQAFTARTGVPVRYVTYEESEAEASKISAQQESVIQFAAQHKDTAEFEKLKARTLEHADAVFRSHLKSCELYDEQINTLFPQQLRSLPEKYRSQFEPTFLAQAEIELANPQNATAEDTVNSAALAATRKAIGLDSDSLQVNRAKLAAFRELARQPLANESHRMVFRDWIIGAKKLGSLDQFKAIASATLRLAGSVQSLMTQQPPATAADLLGVFTEFYKEAGPTFRTELHAISPDFSPDDLLGEFTRCGSLAASILMAEPGALLTPEQADRFFALAADPTLRRDIAILSDQRNSTAKGADQLEGTGVAMGFCLETMAKRCGRDLPAPIVSDLDPRFLSEPTRSLLKENFPESAGFLDGLGRIIAPAAPQIQPLPGAEPKPFPANHKARRDFLLTLLDQHLAKEKAGMERGRNDHGRGHIARVFIMGNAMAGFMEERGIQVDRNLLLCSLAGHDSGRTGGGEDMAEGASADNTVQAMRKACGAASLGEAFEAEVRDLIIQHNRPDQKRPHAQNETTVERMLLGAADSMDYGRIGGRGRVDLGRNPLLKSKGGIERSEAVNGFLEKLADEADMLQKLTNPACLMMPAILSLSDKALNQDGTPEELDRIGPERERIQNNILKEFETQQQMTSEEYMAFVESTVRGNPALFPLLTKYYFNEANGNLQPPEPKQAFDAQRLSAIESDWNNQVQAHLAMELKMPQLFEPEARILSGSALTKFQDRFHQAIAEYAARPLQSFASENDLVSAAFKKAFDSYVAPRKALFEQAGAMEFPSPEVRKAFLAWVSSAGALRRPEEVELVRTKAEDLAGRLAALAQHRTVTSEQLARELMAFFAASKRDAYRVAALVHGVDAGPDDRFAQFDRTFSMAWTFLTAGDPPMIDERQQQKLLAAFSNDLLTDAEIITQAVGDNELGDNTPADVANAQDLGRAISIATGAIRHRAHVEPAEANPERTGPANLSRPMKKLVRSVAPHWARAMRI